MFQIMKDITNVETGVYILWGIALAGLLAKIIMNAHLKKLVKMTENMATTKKRSLKQLRQKYENRLNLGMDGYSSDFVEKNIRNVRFLGVPIVATGKRLNLGVLSTIMVTAGAFLFYDNGWRGSPQMIDFIANSVIVCAFLMSLENIFLSRNKLEIMKANIRDYLDNMSGKRVKVPVRVAKDLGRERPHNISSMESNSDVSQSQPDCICNEEVAVTDVKNDDTLNCFLKEFFS